METELLTFNQTIFFSIICVAVGFILGMFSDKLSFVKAESLLENIKADIVTATIATFLTVAGLVHPIMVVYCIGILLAIHVKISQLKKEI